MRSFAEGSRDLERQVGHGSLTALAHFPGPSSAALERSYWVSGPNAGVQITHYHGGGPHFLAGALDRTGLRRIARACLHGHGSREAFAVRDRTVLERPDLQLLRASVPGLGHQLYVHDDHCACRCDELRLYVSRHRLSGPT